MRKVQLFPAVVGLLCLLLSGVTVANEAPTKPCSAEQNRQFDFWLGDWQVFSPDGKIVGTNKVELKLNGCTLHESWQGVSGSQGYSYSSYDASQKRWVQNWTDNSGFILGLKGHLADGSMVLSGETVGAKGAILNRVTWIPNADKSVTQRWETSSDQGKSWTTAFHGIYKKTVTE